MRTSDPTVQRSVDLCRIKVIEIRMRWEGGDYSFWVTKGSCLTNCVRKTWVKSEKFPSGYPGLRAGIELVLLNWIASADVTNSISLDKLAVCKSKPTFCGACSPLCWRDKMANPVRYLIYLQVIPTRKGITKISRQTCVFLPTSNCYWHPPQAKP